MRIKAIAYTVWMEMLRRKDVYVLLILLAALLAVLLSMNIFGLGGMTDYVKDAALLMIWLFGWILAISVGSRQLPQEETRGTIYPLLAKPIARWELIVGKWLGAWIVVCLAVLSFYVVMILAVKWKGGSLDAIPLIQGYVLQAVLLGILTALAIALSTRMARDATATLSYVLSGAAFLILPRTPELLAHSTGTAQAALRVLYYLLPHLELFDMRRRIVHGYAPAPVGSFFAVLLYGIVLIALFLLLAWLGYRKKRFSRGDID